MEREFQKGWQVNKFTFLKDLFIQKIKSGEWAKGKKIPAERDLAVMFGVTVNTISKVITSLETEGYLKRVHGRGTFVTGKTEKHYSIHIILPEFSYGISPLILAGIVNRSSSLGIALKISVHHNVVGRALEITHSIIEGVPPDGVIIVPPQVGGARERKRVVTMLLRRGIKVVVVDREVEGLELDEVILNNEEGVVALMKHLVDHHGVRDILLVSEKPTRTTLARENAYKKFMEERGFEPRMKRLRYPLLRTSYEFFRELGRKGEIPGAVLAVNDLIAFGAEYAFLEHGLNIGKDVLLVGFDDLPFSAELPVPLTTFRQPFFEMGQKAVDLVVRRLDSPMEPVHKETLRGRLIIRNSCGCNGNQ